MFTGLIQAVGRLQAREIRGGDQRLRFAFGAMPAGDVELGGAPRCTTSRVGSGEVRCG